MVKNDVKVKVRTELRREQIMAAVFQLAAKGGTRGLTISAIAEQVGVSQANLYRHFKNKQDILEQTIERIGEGLAGNLEKVITRTGTPVEKLGWLFRGHLEFISHNEGIPRIIFSEELHLGNRDLRQKLLKAIGSYGVGIESLIQQGQENGSIHTHIDAPALSMTFIGMIQVTILRWSLTDFSFDLVDQGSRLWLNFENCISA
jgi:TetR/AcrR family transcriptional regulator, fatty acid metabolism regulator protein